MIRKELTYNNAKIQTQNIETTTQTPYIMKNYINIKKNLKNMNTPCFEISNHL
jgi:hypothetical protein